MLVFDLELLAIKDPSKADAPDAPAAPAALDSTDRSQALRGNAACGAPRLLLALGLSNAQW